MLHRCKFKIVDFKKTQLSTSYLHSEWIQNKLDTPFAMDFLSTYVERKWKKNYLSVSPSLPSSFVVVVVVTIHPV